MNVQFTMSKEFEELVTTNYATAKLVAEIHKETSCMINYRAWKHDEMITYYHVSWKKGR